MKRGRHLLCASDLGKRDESLVINLYEMNEVNE